jgi:hypothetical protein
MNKTSTSLLIITVNEGRSLIYIFPAVFCAVGAIISFFFLFPLIFLLIPLVILFSLVETGLDYNPSTLQYRKYKSLFGKKWGSWNQLVNPEKFELRLSVERSFSRSAFSQVGSTSYGTATEIARSVTFDLTYDNSTTQDITIFEFQDYKIAKGFLKQLEALNTQPVVNHIAIKLQENMEKRMTRRR